MSENERQQELFEKARRHVKPKRDEKKRKGNKGQVREALLNGDDDDDDFHRDREKWS
jgi:hypothetical protein